MEPKTTTLRVENYNEMAREINELTERCKMLEPALRCADLLRDLAAGRNTSWLDVVDAIRTLDALRYR